MNTSFLQRAIKLGLAATLAMAVVKLLDFPSAFWAPLSALAVMQTQIGGSLASARNYVIASFIGILVGALTVSALGENIVVAGLDVFLIAMLCLALKLPGAVTIAAGVVPVMVLIETPNAWEYGAYRMADILIGLTSALLVSMLLWPARAADALRGCVGAAMRGSGALIGDAFAELSTDSPPTSDAARGEAAIEGQISSAQGLLQAAQQEPSRTPAMREVLPFYISIAERFFEHAASAADNATEIRASEARAAVAPHVAAAGPAAVALANALAAAVVLAEPAPALAEVERTLQAFQTLVSGVDYSSLPSGLGEEDVMHAQTLLLALQGYGREANRLLLRMQNPTSLPTEAELSRVMAAHHATAPSPLSRLLQRVQKRGPA